MSRDEFWDIASFMMDAYGWTGIATADRIRFCDEDNLSEDGDSLLCGEHVVAFTGAKPSVGDVLITEDGRLVKVASARFRTSWHVVIEVLPWP